MPPAANGAAATSMFLASFLKGNRFEALGRFASKEIQ
jgi:hypothetical protein